MFLFWFFLFFKTKKILKAQEKWLKWKNQKKDAILLNIVKFYKLIFVIVFFSFLLLIFYLDNEKKYITPSFGEKLNFYEKNGVQYVCLNGIVQELNCEFVEFVEIIMGEEVPKKRIHCVNGTVFQEDNFDFLDD